MGEGVPMKATIHLRPMPGRWFAKKESHVGWRTKPPYNPYALSCSEWMSAEGAFSGGELRGFAAPPLNVAQEQLSKRLVDRLRADER